jgi:hypothetical protein
MPLFAELKNIEIKKQNCLAKCLNCKKRNVFYSILNGRFVYYCLNCKKWLGFWDVK